MFYFKKNKIIFYLISFSFFTIFFINQTFAQEMGAILPGCAQTGNCSLCDFLIGFSNIAQWLLSILGSVALLFFIYGGFVWLTAGGNEERIKRGRDILTHTVIGVIIVLAAWLIINFVIMSLVGAPVTPNQSVKIFSNKIWYEYCTEGLPSTPTP